MNKIRDPSKAHTHIHKITTKTNMYRIFSNPFVVVVVHFKNRMSSIYSLVQNNAFTWTEKENTLTKSFSIVRRHEHVDIHFRGNTNTQPDKSNRKILIKLNHTNTWTNQIHIQAERMTDIDNNERDRNMGIYVNLFIFLI